MGKEETLERRIKRQGYSWRKFNSVHIYYHLSCVRHSARCAAGAKMTIKTFSLISVAYRVMKTEILSQTSISFCAYLAFFKIAVNKVGHCDFTVIGKSRLITFRFLLTFLFPLLP